MTETEYAAAPPREHEWAVADNRDGTYDVIDLGPDDAGTTLRAWREDGIWVLYTTNGVRVPPRSRPEFDPLLDLLDRMSVAKWKREVAA